MDRIGHLFASTRSAGRAGLACFLTCGDPHPDATDALLDGLVAGGADLVELGMPFSDPMADGVAIQASARRALSSGASLRSVLEASARFRSRHPEIPLVLMGYYNPILRMGAESFSESAARAGVDGLIVVDLPLEEESELRAASGGAGLRWVRLVTPTSHGARLASLLRGAEGFVYYVSVKGITGTQRAGTEALRERLSELRGMTETPIAVGFGLRDASDVAALRGAADAVVVGSSLVERVGLGHARGESPDEISARLRSAVLELRAALDAHPAGKEGR